MYILSKKMKVNKNNWLWWLVGGAFLVLIYEKNKTLPVKKPLYSSRKHSSNMIDTLHPLIRERASAFVSAVKNRLGIDLHVVQGLRTFAEQDKIYQQGRTTPGKIVSNAKPGDSLHNYGLAFDVAPFVNGKLKWDIDWAPVAAIAKEFGFQWGGDFKSFKDKPHFEDKFGHTVHELYAMQQQQPGKTYLDNIA